MLRIDSEPELRDPVLLCGFGGWADAASAATGALRYLLIKREGEVVAQFDPDSIFVYTQTRPLTLINEQGERHLQWPQLTMTVVRVPEAAHDLVILLGPEPDLRWRECVGALLDYASRLGISRLLTFGAFLAQVHFSGPPAMLGISSDPVTRSRLRQLGIAESSYQGPTGFVTALLREAIDRGMPAASLWVAAPSYLSNTSNPKLAAALLRAAEVLLGQGLWRDELEAAGHDMDRRIEEALQARPDLASFLQKLSGETAESEAEAPQEEEHEPDFPSAEEVLRDLEDHLRSLRGKSEDEPGNGR